MPFITGGHPSLEVTAQLMAALGPAGASIIEIGFPFSDPIADGPVIADSMHDALSAGVTPAAIFDLVSQLRDRTELGLVAMVSHSIIRRIGEEDFISQASDAGFDGLIVPDIDIDQVEGFSDSCRARDLTLSLLVAQTTPPARLERILTHCSGFVYLLARAGITGERDASPEIERAVAKLKQRTSLPIAAGFGISSAAHVHAVTNHADAAIVGSALVRRMSASADPVGQATQFIGELSQGLATR